MSLLWGIELVRYLGLVAILGAAAWQDYKTGQVSNKFWLFAFIGVPLLLIENFMYPNFALVIFELISVAIAVFLATLFYSLRGWGGADTKAFATIALCAPLFPAWGIFYPLPLPLAVLFVSCLLSVVYAIVKPTNESWRTRKVRFLPFMFAGLLFALLL